MMLKILLIISYALSVLSFTSTFTSSGKSLLRPFGLDKSTGMTQSIKNQNRIKLRLNMGVLDNFKKLVGSQDGEKQLIDDNDKLLTKYMTKVEEINALEDILENMSDPELISKTNELKEKLKSGKKVNDVLVEAFALVREASWRILQLRHYDVQLLGGMALNDGRLAEMATGEGKTLVAILPAFLNALTGESSLVITTSDYLARRDGETMGQVLRFLGMSVGVIQNYMKEDERKQAYACDVTYIANQELGFDYLRDNLATSSDQIVQYRPFNFCVVDEADSILVDEARTPLIISRKGAPATDKFITSASIAKNLNIGEHYEVDIKEQKVQITQKGYKFAEQILGKGLFDLKDSWAFFILNAIKARELYNEGSEYIIDNGEIRVIDSFSGRVLEGRRFSDGIQQSIEAKESLTISSETQTVAKITYQNLFRLFPKLSGMTGTAFTEAAEFIDVYNLKVLPVPTALPIARRDNPDAVFRTQTGKMKALLKNVITNHDKGRPILIGTTSVESSEEIAKALKDLEIKVNVLNAKPENVEFESETVAQAGRMGAVTVATNMAGRGTDILLGGSPKGLAKILAKWMILNSLGKFDVEDIVVVVDEEIEESIVDVDVVVPNDSSDTEATTELEFKSENNTNNDDVNDDDDEEEYIFTPEMEALPSINSIAVARELNLPVVLSKRTEYKLKKAVLLCKDALTKMTSDAEESNISLMEIEELIATADDRIPTTEMTIKALRSSLKSVTKEFEESMKLEREKVKRLGGLYVIGTSRHESRRIDNQLRGRAGRQGDPGASRFFLSLDDELFRVFGGDKMGSLLDNFRVAEDMPIESDLVVQALDKVQTQVEDYFRMNRQQIFQLDEVTSSQRTKIYSQRRDFLKFSDEDMLNLFTKFCQDTMDEILKASMINNNNGRKESISDEKLVSKALQFFPNLKLSNDDIIQFNSKGSDINTFKTLLYGRLDDAIQQKKVEVDSLSPWAFVAFFRYLALVQIDESWCKHLSRLDLLKEEIVLQSMSSDKGFLETYEESANEVFKTLLDDVRRNTVYSLFIYQGAK